MCLPPGAPLKPAAESAAEPVTFSLSARQIGGRAVREPRRASGGGVAAARRTPRSGRRCRSLSTAEGEGEQGRERGTHCCWRAQASGARHELGRSE